MRVDIGGAEAVHGRRCEKEAVNILLDIWDLVQVILAEGRPRQCSDGVNPGRPEPEACVSVREEEYVEQVLAQPWELSVAPDL